MPDTEAHETVTPDPMTLADAMPTLGGLAEAIGLRAGRHAGLPLAGIAADHRQVAEGYAFFAMPGTRVDGARFIPDALEAGATAIICAAPRPVDLDPIILYLEPRNMRRALSKAAAYLYPGQPKTIAAVTGTAGKTSVAEFTRQIFAALGRRAASLGTLGIVGPDGASYGSLTTPDPITLHKTLDRLAGEGVTHLAMEASSHGLDQARLDGVRLSAAGFTNLGRDHLDYHPTVESYFAAKLRLFEDLLPEGAPALVNLDGDRGAEAAVAASLAGRNVWTIGQRGQEIGIVSIEPTGFGQDVVFRYKRKDYPVHLPLMGAFQVENAALAAGFALALGEKPKPVFKALGELKGVPGRLERVGAFNAAPVFVDYAHKPEALAYALAALRPYVTGKLVVVFGCGGDRDPGKRPIMGRIAAGKADLVIVTDDNPRSEEPASIRAAILEACPGGIEIGDRAAAIREAVGGLEPGDALLVAGKGHETGQIVGNETLPFSDHEVARAAIEALT
jgi:UDP-N-acetylmuramoyl-L-alanyl-D-glutamate--2,6-diaminopimelate ligase